MDIRRGGRDREIALVFVGTFRHLRPVLSRYELSAQELREFRQDLFVWFQRFARRPGNEVAPASSFEGALSVAARQGINSYHRWKEANPGSSDEGQGPEPPKPEDGH